jgi:RNA polymerase sigma-70 factor (ECF subfamily)
MAPNSTFDTFRLHGYLEQMRAGDRRAADALLLAVGDRLERLARRMLKGFPQVRRRAETGDVLQGALVRLLRTLGELRPQTTRDFINLAAVHIRRELLDLARYFSSRLDRPAGAPPAEGDTDPLGEVPDRDSTLDDLDRWAAFHEAVEGLPVEEREVVGLSFYHGWTQAQIAELLQVSDRQVRRYWSAASLRLEELLGERMPEA